MPTSVPRAPGVTLPEGADIDLGEAPLILALEENLFHYWPDLSDNSPR
jgi:hypothetical protein